LDFIDLIPRIPANQKYWFIRTSSGEYYDNFVNEGFVGIGWNKVGIESFNSNIPLNEIVKENYPDENRPNHVANQIRTLANEIKKGDIVLIPSAKSTYIHFGIVDDDEIYEEDLPIEIEDLENHPELEFNYEGVCPYIKRRRVSWIKVRKRDNLDPQLYRLIYSQHTISSANQYSEYIDRALFDYFIKGDRCHLVLHVEKKGNIKGNHLVRFMSDLLNVTDIYNKEKEDEVDLKVSVQSPGTIELIGIIPVIMLTSIAVVTILGGRTKFIGMELDTPGIIGRILEWKNRNQNQPETQEPVNVPEPQQESLVQNAENLSLKLPESLEKAVKQYMLEMNKELALEEANKEEE
jgi:restriction system protein